MYLQTVVVQGSAATLESRLHLGTSGYHWALETTAVQSGMCVPRSYRRYLTQRLLASLATLGGDRVLSLRGGPSLKQTLGVCSVPRPSTVWQGFFFALRPSLSYVLAIPVFSVFQYCTSDDRLNLNKSCVCSITRPRLYHLCILLTSMAEHVNSQCLM